ncbi:hypothetical protein FRC04_006665 [Tulasnella sp. 424]|nr:hypothetical protein FRC04_006665 [Tulasnella sp. 424]KAG8975309.1 hypothetical protein FRC05_005867 [Tulasnella sp. 425]
MPTINQFVALATNLGLALAQTTITVNVGTTLQQIDGFGVSQAFGRASEFQAMASGPRATGLDYLFSTTTGAGLTIIRNRIGSGGSGDSIEPNSPGSPSAAPTYVWDNNDSGQVWFSQQAMSYGVKTIYADAWSAPGFMKTNGNQGNGGWLCGVTGKTCSSGDWRQAYANFLVQYVKYYQQAGIPITHLGFLNEPDYVTSYSSMQSDAPQAASFIPTLYNTLNSNGLSNIKITCCDATGWSAQQTLTSGLVSAGMEQYLGVITSHMYSGDPNSPLSTKLKVWETEGADLNDAWCTTWYSNGGACEGLTWANKIQTGIVNANLSAYLYWEGVEVNEFQASSYLVASDGTTVTPSGRLWAFAMWSRFIRPGAYRVSTSGTISGVGIAAFKNPLGTVVVVLTNTGSTAQSVNLQFTGFVPNSADVYLTDNNNTVAPIDTFPVGGTVYVTVTAHGVLTVIMNPKLTPVTTKTTTTTKTPTGTPTPTTIPTTSTTSSTTTTTTTTTTTSTAAGCVQTHYGQCGGSAYTGCTQCASGTTCKFSNSYYSQCL